MSSTKSTSDKQQGQHNQQQNMDPKRMGNRPVEPQRNDRASEHNQQIHKDQQNSQRSNQATR